MTDSTILPGARAALVTGQGQTSPEFYRLFQALARAAGLTGDLQTQVTEITKTVEVIAQKGTGTILPGTGIVVDGSLADGAATISLDGAGVAAGVYGDSAHIPQLSVDSYGRVTQAQLVAVQPAFVPYRVADGDTFTVPEGSQALWAVPINLEGTAGLEIDGALVEVN